MTDATIHLVQQPFVKAIASAAEAANLPKAERMKIHRENIQRITFHEGVAGTSRYKLAYPEAASIRVKLNVLAFVPKPAGYDAELVSTVDGWLCNPVARSSTNIADVERLNDHLGTSYPPGKHFSEPLSKGRMEKIKAVFSSYGLPLDIKAVRTMSAVKAAAVAAKTVMAGERRLGRAGVISGNTLVIAGQPFTITRNGDRECIRVIIGGERQRISLDQIKWLADLLGDCRDDPLDTHTCMIREAAYPVKTLKIDPDAALEVSDMAFVETLSLSERIIALAAKRPKQFPQHPYTPEDVDPLAFCTPD